MNKIIRSPWLLFGTFFLLTFFTYYPVISAHRRVDADAQIILPLLDSWDNPVTYILDLLSFKTIDLQPIRDLSLVIDQFFYAHLNTNTFAFQNALIWGLCCFLVFRLLRSLFPETDERKLYLCVVAFTVYPLFSSTIPWGMARKHLLSMCFILLATCKLTGAGSALTKKEKGFIISSFFLAMLSQPISLFWPVWAWFYVKRSRPDLIKSFNQILPVLIFILIVIGLVNFFYYEMSPVFLKNFPKKTSTPFYFGGQLLAVGHYFTTLVAPYFLSFYYTLGHWTTLTGIVLLVFAGYFHYKYNERKMDLWFGFMLFPLITILQSPQIIYDTYLLIPAVGCLVLIIHSLRNVSWKTFQISASILIPLWMSVTFITSQRWLSMASLTKESFDNVPDCITAMVHVRTQYEKGLAPAPETLKYVRDYQCVKQNIQTDSKLNEAKLIQSQIMFYDDKLPLDWRLNVLREGMKTRHFQANIYYTALLIKTKKGNEISQPLGELVQNLKLTPNKVYDFILETTVLTYCRKTGNTECVEAVVPFTQKSDVPYY